MKSADDKKQGALINTEENQNIIQEELDDLEDWSNRNRRRRCRSAKIRCRSARSLTWGLMRRKNAINWKCNSYIWEKRGKFAYLIQLQNACEAYDCQKSIANVFPAIIQMDKNIIQVVRKSFFRVYSSKYMKTSLKKFNWIDAAIGYLEIGVSGYGCVSELLQIWEECWFTTYNKVVSAKYLPARSCLMVNSR